jgi:hypothetical protein
MRLNRSSSSGVIVLVACALAACSNGSVKGSAGTAGGGGTASGAAGASGGGAAGASGGGAAGASGGGTAGGAAGGSTAVGTGGAAGASGGAAGGGSGAGGASAAGASGASGAGGASGGAGGASAGGSGGVGGASPDGGAGASGNPCATAIFCDDFEAYTAGGAPKGQWKVTTNNGTISVDGTHAHSGKNAVHALTTGAQSYESAYIGLVGAPVFPVAGNNFFGRMMMYATQAPADVVHWTIIQGEGPVPAHNVTNAVVRYGGQYNLRFMANYDSSPPKSDCWHHSTTTIPLNKWSCVEWQFDGSTSTQRFWLDGQPVADLTVVGKGDGCIAHDLMDNWYAPNYNALRLGWEHYQLGPGEVWIDDVAVAAQRVGCPTN